MKTFSHRAITVCSSFKSENKYYYIKYINFRFQLRKEVYLTERTKYW